MNTRQKTFGALTLSLLLDLRPFLLQDRELLVEFEGLAQPFLLLGQVGLHRLPLR